MREVKAALEKEREGLAADSLVLIHQGKVRTPCQRFQSTCTSAPVRTRMRAPGWARLTLCAQVLADESDLATNNISEAGFLVVMAKNKVGVPCLGASGQPRRGPPGVPALLTDGGTAHAGQAQAARSDSARSLTCSLDNSRGWHKHSPGVHAAEPRSWSTPCLQALMRSRPQPSAASGTDMPAAGTGAAPDTAAPPAAQPAA